MEKYENGDNFNERKHIIEVTFQRDEFKGTIKKEISGNCFGNDVLTFFGDFEDIDTNFLLENNINLQDLGDGWIKYYLKNTEGELLECEEDSYDLRKSVVKIEIVNCEVLNS